MTEGDTAVRAGRQSGKSFAQAIRTMLLAINHKGKKKAADDQDTILITGGVERQAYELYMKVRRMVETLAPHMIVGRPTMRKMELKNNCRVLALPAGRDGAGLRNFCLIRLVVDEAHYVYDEVYNACEPMLATTGGNMDLLSTPKGNKGRFYDAFQEDSGFTTFHTTSEMCPRIPKDFLERKKKSLTKMRYAQEYLAEFQDKMQQMFPKELVDSCIVKAGFEGTNFLGVDFAGYGGDQNAFVTLANLDDRSFIKEFEVSERVKAWETVQKIIELNIKFKYKKIGVDDGGLGTPILDYILTHNSLKRKTIGLNNASRAINNDGKAKRLLKEDMYGNLKLMMEQGLIVFEENEDLRNSLDSIQFEIDEGTENLKIFGNYSHITEGLIRAAWLIKTKGLKLWVA